MSDRRKYLLLALAIVAALVGALLLAVPGSPIYKKPTLGLDLQGGLEVVLRAVPPKGHKLTAEDLDRSISIMQNRINKLGVSEPEIRKQGSNQIVIQLAGVHDTHAAAALIGKTDSHWMPPAEAMKARLRDESVWKSGENPTGKFLRLRMNSCAWGDCRRAASAVGS